MHYFYRALILLIHYVAKAKLFVVGFDYSEILLNWLKEGLVWQVIYYFDSNLFKALYHLLLFMKGSIIAENGETFMLTMDSPD